MFKKISINLLTVTFFFSVVNYLDAQEGFHKKTQEKLYKKDNVKKEEARNEVGRAIFSIGFSTPAIGNDPCQGVEKTMGGLETYSTKDISLGKLPGKPPISVGKQGQIMEGEVDYSAENVCYEGYDSQGNKCVEATANPDGTITLKNTSDSKCAVVIGEKQTVELSPKSEIIMNTQQDKGVSKDLLEGLGKARSWIMDKMPDWTKSTSSPSRSTAGGVRGNCDPEGIAGGCRVNAGSGVVQATIPEYLNTMVEAEKKGLAKKLRWTRVNPSPESAGPTEGPTPYGKSYPEQSTKSGYEKEKGSKISKGETIINPSESASGRGGRSIDFCGRHLPTPEQAASMGFDPGKITDPANRDWTGRIEQRGTERTLTWSKTVSTVNGSVKIEYSYKEGELIAINYEFFDRKGSKIGYATFDGKNRTVEAKRLK